MSNPYGLRPPDSASALEVAAAIKAEWPGPEPASGRDDLLRPREHEIYRAYRGWYQLFANLYAGGRRIHRPPPGTIHPISGEVIESYLERHEKETLEEYDRRRRTAFTLPYCRDIVRIFTSTMFRQEVDRTPIREALPEQAILDDLDLQGHSAREYLRRAFGLAHVYGWCGHLTDLPYTEDPEVVTILEQRRSGLRPYTRPVIPLRLPYWERDPLTGEFLLLLIWETAEVWTWWTPSAWIRVDRDGAVIDAQMHDFGRIPFDILVCEAPDDESDQPFGLSALSDVALIALHIYQMCSLLEDHERRALFAFLHIPRQAPRGGGVDADAKAPDLHVGGSHYLWIPDTPSWVEPPASVPEEARAQILWAIEEMRQASGIGVGSERSLEQRSAVALQWEYSSRHNAVYERAQNLEDFESRLWQTYGQILGVDVPADAVRYPRDYAVRSIEQEIGDVERLVALFGGWAAVPDAIRPYLAVKLRRVAAEDVSHLPEWQEIAAAIESITEDRDGDGTTRPPIAPGVRPGGNQPDQPRALDAGEGEGGGEPI